MGRGGVVAGGSANLRCLDCGLPVGSRVDDSGQWQMVRLLPHTVLRPVKDRAERPNASAPGTSGLSLTPGRRPPPRSGPKPQAQANFTDPELRIMKNGDDAYRPTKIDEATAVDGDITALSL